MTQFALQHPVATVIIVATVSSEISYIVKLITNCIEKIKNVDNLNT